MDLCANGVKICFGMLYHICVSANCLDVQHLVSLFFFSEEVTKFYYFAVYDSNKNSEVIEINPTDLKLPTDLVIARELEKYHIYVQLYDGNKV